MIGPASIRAGRGCPAPHAACARSALAMPRTRGARDQATIAAPTRAPTRSATRADDDPGANERPGLEAELDVVHALDHDAPEQGGELARQRDVGDEAAATRAMRL